MKRKEQIEILVAALTQAAMEFEAAQIEARNEVWKEWARSCAKDAWAALREAEA